MLRSMSVKDHMTAGVLLRPDMDVLEAVHLLLRHNVYGGPVVDNLGNVIGILSEKDCIEAVVSASYYEEKAGKVSEFMTRGVETVDADASLMDVAELFLKHPHRGYPVVEDNRLVGVVTRRDILWALEKMW